MQNQNPRLLVLSLALLILGSASASAASDKVAICHVTGSGNVHALSVSESAVPAHLEHGDFLAGSTEGPNDGPTTPDEAIACGGGNNTSIQSHPYQVSIQRLVGCEYVHRCGGAYVGGNKIVTAASCVSEGTDGDYRVGFGSTNLSTMTTVISVASRAIHPDYTGTDAGLEFNVAVLRLASTPPISPGIGPIAMAASSAGDFVGQNVQVTGWGDTANTPQIVNDVLHVGTVTVITNTACSALINGPITDGHLCGNSLSLDPCTGDVGGPVRAGNTLAGIQSWPIDLTVPYSSASTVPRVATRVSTVRAWIDSQ